jgi:hypothetical protein
LESGQVSLERSLGWKIGNFGLERNASNLGATEWREFNRAPLLCSDTTRPPAAVPVCSKLQKQNEMKKGRRLLICVAVGRNGQFAVRPSTCHGDVGCFALTWFRCAGRPRTDLAPPCLSGPSSEIAQTAPWIMDELCH